MMTTTEGEFQMIVRRVAQVVVRELSQGATPDQAERTAWLEVSQEYKGERVYIAGAPKAQRAQQIAKLKKASTREVVTATGMHERTVRRILRGR